MAAKHRSAAKIDLARRATAEGVGTDLRRPLQPRRHHGAPPEPDQALLHEIRADPRRATLENLFREIAKLEQVRALQLPTDLFEELSAKGFQGILDRLFGWTTVLAAFTAQTSP